MSSNKYGLGAGPVWIRGLNCTGKESHLFDCPVVNIPPNIDLYCNDAGVLCTGKMKDICPHNDPYLLLCGSH